MCSDGLMIAKCAARSQHQLPTGFPSHHHDVFSTVSSDPSSNFFRLRLGLHNHRCCAPPPHRTAVASATQCGQAAAMTDSGGRHQGSFVRSPFRICRAETVMACCISVSPLLCLALSMLQPCHAFPGLSCIRDAKHLVTLLSRH